MKIMTLNTHSLAEPEYESKLAAFAGSLVQIKPDIIALQEVNQSRSAPPAASGWLRESGYVLLCQRLKHSLPLRLPGSHTRRQPRP